MEVIILVVSLLFVGFVVYIRTKACKKWIDQLTVQKETANEENLL